MKEISFEEMRKLQLKMLEAVIDVCKSNNITYYLGGGTMLGAARHKGFIPWDDDIDINFLRPDYDKLIGIFKKENYKLISIFDITGEFMWYQIVDTRTSIVGDDKKYGVYMDLFPIDAWPNKLILHKPFCLIKDILMYMYQGSVMKYESTPRYNER